MSDIREMLIDTAKKILGDHCTKETVLKAENGQWPEQLWNTFQETEMNLVGIPEENGGVGGDLGDALSLLKVAGYFAAPIPIAENFLANWLITSVDLRAIHGPLTIAPVEKEEIVNFSRVKNGWRVNGRCSHVPWARQVEKIVLVGRNEDGTYMVAVLNKENCEIVEHENLAGEPRDIISIQDSFIPDAEAAISLHFNEEEFSNLCSLTRVALAAGSLEKILEVTLNYSKERIQFGRAIGKFQAVKQQIAVLAEEVVAANIAANSAIAAANSGLDSIEFLLAKIQINESIRSVTNIAHQLLGAIGFTNEHTLHLCTRRLWSWQDEFGSQKSLAHSLGSYVLSKSGSELWPMLTRISNRKGFETNEELSAFERS